MSGEAVKRALPRTGYPRRRAVTACEVCRERKKKWSVYSECLVNFWGSHLLKTDSDNIRPSCSFCQNTGARCKYRGRDESSFDPSCLAILNRLSALETLMRQHNCARLSAKSPTHSQPRLDGETPSSVNESFFGEPLPLLSSPSANLWELHTGADSKVRLDTVLQWPIFEEPLSSLRRHPFLTFKKEQDYTYLEDMFSVPSIEPSPVPYIHMGKFELERLVDRFFILVHVKNPILDRDVVKQYCCEYLKQGPEFDLQSCLILLICALASVAPDFLPSGALGPAHRQSRSQSTGEDLTMGRTYFMAAEQRLGMAMTQHNSLAVQCLCLAGIYHMYRVNPMAGRTMFHSAGYVMQVLASTGSNNPDESSRMGSSLYWACFKSERELFAEIPIAIPAIGRPSQIDSFPLPPRERFMTWGGSNDSWAQAEQDSWYFFLSEIAMRRIMDKVAEHVGNFFAKIDSCDPVSMQTVLAEYAPVALELERQAIAWREHLPPSIRFPDPPTPAGTEWILYTRQPFFRTVELIYRPFLFACVHGLDSEPLTCEFANKGLRYAQQYLQSCHPTHPHHGRALQMRNELKMVATLFSASRTGLQMPSGWYEDVRAVVRTLRYWEPAVSFLRSYIDVILALDDYFSGGDSKCTGSLAQDLQHGL